MRDVEDTVNGIGTHSSMFFESLEYDMFQEEVEESWCKDTTLANPVIDVEGLGDLAICLDSGTGVCVELAKDALKLAREG